jgi:flagellar biosynthesis protein FliR
MTAAVELLAWLEGDGLSLFWSGFLAFVRVGAAMAVLPLFGEQSLPVRFRLGAALGLTILVAPSVTTPVSEVTPLAILAETTAGLLLGAGFRLFVVAIQTAGAMAAQAISLSQLFAGAGGEPLSSVSQLLSLAALALGFTLGLHIKAAEALILSYSLMPQGRFASADDVVAWGLPQVARSFSLAFSLAAPFVIGGLLYNLALGAINRAMPTLMVTFIGAPALTLGGMALLMVTAPMMLQVWLGAWQDWLANPFAVPR